MKLLIIALFLSIISYFALDRELSLYGKNDFNVYNRLPFSLVAKHKGYDEGNFGFTLEDKNGFAIISKGNKLKDGDSLVYVDRIDSYYFDKNEIVLSIKDIALRDYLIQVTYSKEKNHNLKVLNEIDDLISKKNISLDRDLDTLYYSRNYLLFIIIILSIYAPIKYFKKRR